MTLTQIAVEFYDQVPGAQELGIVTERVFVRLPDWGPNVKAEVFRSMLGRPMPVIQGVDDRNRICPVSLNLWIDNRCAVSCWSPSADECMSDQWELVEG
jgi:hypothetical protein